MGDEAKSKEVRSEEEEKSKALRQGSGQAQNEKRKFICDRCGFEMHEKNCKVICPNCGNRFDCSDLNIYFD